MKVLATLAIAVAVTVVGAVGFAYSGWYDVSASSSHSGPVKWLLGKTSHASIERHAGDIAVPDLSDATLALAGVNDFAAMCAGCHGAPGQEREAIGQGLNPPAPDLAESAAHLSPAELFWVTKHGIKMTGMPSWGATHDDQAIWPVVAFMTILPELKADEYHAYLARAEDMGHHSAADESGQGEETISHGHDAPTPDSDAASSDQPAGHDHSTHSHELPKAKSNEDAEHRH